MIVSPDTKPKEHLACSIVLKIPPVNLILVRTFTDYIDIRFWYDTDPDMDH